MKSFLMVAAVLACSGCSAVFVPEPMGSEPADISAEAGDWQGTWLSSDASAVTVQVADGSNGLLRVAWDEARQDGITHETADLVLRRFCDGLYVSTRSNEKDAANKYAWARIKRQDRVLLVWSPDVARFRSLVDEGTLPGSTNGESVVLGSLDSNHLDLICRRERDLLRWDEPQVFWKVGN